MKKHFSERNLFLFLGAAILLAIVALLLFASPAETDQRPTTYSTSTEGARATYQLFGALGYHVQRFESSEDHLSTIDAQHSTLILASPDSASGETQSNAIKDFLHRGGRVLATGALGAGYLPGGGVRKPSGILFQKLCYTTPEGIGPLAQAGNVSMSVESQWHSDGPNVSVAQNCSGNPVVVSYPVDSGLAIWWASSQPLSNAGLKNSPNIQLLLASVGGTDRTLFFDENIHGINAEEELASLTKGAPITALYWQAAAIALLLLLSQTRRNASPLTINPVPRSSPLEFSVSMGALYQKAGASQVAIESSYRRLMQFLEHQGGISRETLASEDLTVAQAVNERFSINTNDLLAALKNLRASREAPMGRKNVLALVKALDTQRLQLQRQLSSPTAFTRGPHCRLTP